MKNDCVILAAGLSSRMGFWKPALEIDGMPMVLRSVLNAKVHSKQIIVVGGHRFGDLRDILAGIPDILLVENPHFEKGMLTSMKASLEHISSESFFLTLADMPFIQPDTFAILAEKPFRNALFPLYKGRRGHPVLVNLRLKDTILSAPDNHMMKDVLNRLPVSEVEVHDPGILKDIDRPLDIERNLNKS